MKVYKSQLFFPIWIIMYAILETYRNKLKKHSVSKIVLVPVSVISKTFFSHSRSEQFWKQNTILIIQLIIVITAKNSLCADKDWIQIFAGKEFLTCFKFRDMSSRNCTSDEWMSSIHVQLSNMWYVSLS